MDPIGKILTGDRPRRIVVALLGGLLAWGLLEVSYGSLKFADRAAEAAGFAPAPEASLRVARLLGYQEAGNAGIALGTLGAAYGSVFGAFGTRNRPWPSPMVGAAIGLGIGVLAGWIGSAAFATRDVGDQALIFTSAVEGLVWALLGLAAGLATRRSTHVAVAGAIAGAAWGLLYPLAAAVFAPWAHIERTVPDSTPLRAAWAVLGGCTLGCAVIGAAAKAGPAKSRDAAETAFESA